MPVCAANGQTTHVVQKQQVQITQYLHLANLHIVLGTKFQQNVIYIKELLLGAQTLLVTVHIMRQLKRERRVGKRCPPIVSYYPRWAGYALPTLRLFLFKMR
jgi:hypothetical protein